MITALDLTKRHWTHRRRGILAIGTWLQVANGQWRPCMALIREDDVGKDGAIPCVVTLDKAYIWHPPTAEAAHLAMQFCEILRIDTVNRRNVRNLAVFINDMLGDLLSMPPAPAGFVDLTQIGDLIIRDQNGRLVSEIVLSDV
jgi:hypothetical protein